LTVRDEPSIMPDSPGNGLPDRKVGAAGPGQRSHTGGDPQVVDFKRLVDGSLAIW
jgi:hypothetical protein